MNKLKGRDLTNDELIALARDAGLSTGAQMGFAIRGYYEGIGELDAMLEIKAAHGPGGALPAALIRLDLPDRPRHGEYRHRAVPPVARSARPQLSIRPWRAGRLVVRFDRLHLLQLRGAQQLHLSAQRATSAAEPTCRWQIDGSARLARRVT